MTGPIDEKETLVYAMKRIYSCRWWGTPEQVNIIEISFMNMRFHSQGNSFEFVYAQI